MSVYPRKILKIIEISLTTKGVFVFHMKALAFANWDYGIEIKCSLLHSHEVLCYLTMKQWFMKYIVLLYQNTITYVY